MKRYFLLTVFFTILAVIVTWPLILHLNNSIIDRFDGLLITWFLNWDIHSLTNGLGGFRNLYNANIFFPYQGTLAFSETMLPQSVIALPFALFFKEPLLAYNINLFLGFILTGIATFLLTHYLTKDNKTSLTVSIIFTFSTIHLNYLPHLQLFNFWPVIFSTYFFLRQKYLLFIMFFLISSLTTALFFYFLLLICAVIILSDWKVNKTKQTKPILSIFLAVLLTSPFLIPYLLVSRQFNYIRPINDSIHFSLQFPDLLNISKASRLSLLIPPTSQGTPAFPGLVFAGLILYFLNKLRLKGIKQFSKSNDQYLFLCFLLIAAGSFILALGPALHIFPNTAHVGPIPAIPLPYAVLYYLLPGFSGFRTPSRWIILTFFSLAVCLALFLSQRKLSSKTIVLLTFVALLEINFPFQYTKVPSLKDFPPEQVWLKDNYQGAPIIQFPIYRWDDQPQFGLETLREYYSTIHWHPMYNGYSGFSPKAWEQRVKWLQKNFPSEESIAYLKSLKIKLVLTPVAWQTRINQYTQLKLIKTFRDTNIYELT